jgi:DNA-binding Lrp family transcriptional regulator
MTKRSSLDSASIKILEILQDNADISNADLAERVGLSPSPCWRRVAELREQSIIRHAVTLIDPDKLGLHVNVFINVTLKQQDEESLRVFTDAVAKRSEVMECYLMTGEADYMLRAVVEDLRCYQELLLKCLTQIPVVSTIRSSFALNQIKYTTALPTDHLK